MNPALTAIAVGVVASGLVAVCARETRAAVLGVALALVLAPLLTSTPDGVLPLAARVVAAVLAAYLLSVAVRGAGATTAGSRLGWPAEAAFAGAAGVAGYAAAGLGAPPEGSAEAQAAAFALFALAVLPVARGRDALRLAVGLILLVAATALLRSALAGTPTALEELAWAGLTVAVASGAAALTAAARTSAGSLELTELGRVGARARLPDAHPAAVRERVAAAAAATPAPTRRPALGVARRAARWQPRPTDEPPAWAVTWTEPPAQERQEAPPPTAETEVSREPTPLAELPLEVEAEFELEAAPARAPDPIVEIAATVTAPIEPAVEPPVEEPVEEPAEEPAAAIVEEPAAAIVEEPPAAIVEEPPAAPEEPPAAPESPPLHPRIRPRSVAGRGPRIMRPPPEKP